MLFPLDASEGQGATTDDGGGPDPYQLVVPVHAAVPGRVRWHVRGLRNNPSLKATLEAGLAEVPEIDSARASAETGNLLTCFTPGIALDRIRLIIGDFAAGRRHATSPGMAPEWHAQSLPSIATSLHSSPTEGLGQDAAAARLAEHGGNALKPQPARSALEILVGQFKGLPAGMLAGAAVVSCLTGGIPEAVAILSVLSLNGILGTVVESRSERTLQSLAEASHEPVPVIRGGKADVVPPDVLVPGDLIVLRIGAVVPADARLVTAQNLRVNEAMLTGESMPVAKQVEPVEGKAPLADRRCMVYRGTSVTAGSATAIVVATGANTEMGRIQRLVGTAAKPMTPMQKQLDVLGRQLIWASLAACGAVAGVGALRGIAIAQLLRSGLSLAIAAIPEGLPTVATTGLSIGIEEMRRKGALVRRLDAVESLASVTVVCFDKTGTLTLNQMRVTDVATPARSFRARTDGGLSDPDGNLVMYDGSGDALSWLLRAAVLCSDAGLEWKDDRLTPVGSATETALLRLALDAGLGAEALRVDHPTLAIRHRALGYRYMATAHQIPGEDSRVLVAVKGNPMEVLALCRFELREGEPVALTHTRRADIERINTSMASDALRVLGFAFSPAVALDGDLVAALPGDDLIWLGMAAMADPIRPGMDALIAALHEAGLHTVMMTGDQVGTARAVARQLRLGGDEPIEVVDVAALEGLTEQELAQVAQRAHVFARVAPADKLRLVHALQAAGERIAMTGDGINDSPALKAADVGVAMGGGASSQAAREVADLVLLTDDLTTLADAIARGRATFSNVRKSIRYLLATNLSEILVVLGATAAGFGEPLTTMQLLWINLISDVLPGLGLTFEAPEPGLMQRPPESGTAPMVEREQWSRLGLQAGVIASGSLAALGWGALRHGPGQQARTMAFGSLVTSQLLHALTSRSDQHGPLTGGAPLPPNRTLTGLLLGSVAFQALAMLVPGVRNLLGVVPLGPVDLAITATAGALPYLANEALKGERLVLDRSAPAW